MTLPTESAVTARLMAILARGSVNLGATAGIERLMLMLTRSCHLRCPYCLVSKTETGPVMPRERALQAVDLVLQSRRPRLEIQFFGGEPTAEWDTLCAVLEHTMAHPARRGRPVEFVLTSNGLTLTRERVAHLARYPLMFMFSLDGDRVAQRRGRPVRKDHDTLTDDSAWDRIEASVDLLLGSDLRWFMNAVLPPSMSGDLMARYTWAKARGIPALQLNYAVGMRWRDAQTRRYLDGLIQVLHAHHADPGNLQLFNWRSDCEPVMLSDDLIVDVDGTVLHDGAIFLERRFPELVRTYRRGHLDGLTAFDPLRWPLAKLYEVMLGTYPQGSEERAILLHDIRLGAAVDLVIQQQARALGRA